MIIETQNGQRLEVPNGSGPEQIDEVLNHFQGQAKGLIGRIGEGWQKDLTDFNNIGQNGETGLERAAQGVGTYAKALTRPITEAAASLMSTVSDNTADNAPYKVIGSGINDLYQGSEAQGLVKDAKQIYNKAAQENPRLAAASTAFLNMAAALPVTKGVGAVGEVVEGAAKKIATNKSGTMAAKALLPQNTADLEKLTSHYYNLADSQGGTLNYNLINGVLEKSGKVAPQTPEGKAFTGNNSTTQAVQDLEQLRDKPLSLGAFEEIDKNLSSRIEKETDSFGKVSEDGRNLLQIRQHLRDAAENAGKDDLVNGQGFETYRTAQQLAATKFRMADIDRIYQKAESAENPQTVIKNGFAKLRDSGMRGYTDAEKSAIKSAAKTGLLTGALKVGGSRIISGMTGATAGAAGGGVPGAILGAGAAEAVAYPLRKAAGAMQAAKGAKVTDLLLNRPVVLTAAQIGKLPPIEAIKYLKGIKQ